jgi:hypothetical protein
MWSRMVLSPYYLRCLVARFVLVFVEESHRSGLRSVRGRRALHTITAPCNAPGCGPHSRDDCRPGPIPFCRVDPPVAVCAQAAPTGIYCRGRTLLCVSTQFKYESRQRGGNTSMSGMPIFSSMEPEMRKTVRQSVDVPRRQPNSIRSIRRSAIGPSAVARDRHQGAALTLPTCLQHVRWAPRSSSRRSPTGRRSSLQSLFRWHRTLGHPTRHE